MAPEELKLYSYLKSLSIAYSRYEHPPVYTVEEAEKHWTTIKAQHCKNLFFRNPKGNQHYLLIAPAQRRLDISVFSERIQSGRLSFASEVRLNKYLGVTPGSVSLFGLINDTENHVQVYIDLMLKQADRVAFHPNINSCTLTISGSDMIKFLDSVGNPYRFIDLTP